MQINDNNNIGVKKCGESIALGRNIHRFKNTNDDAANKSISWYLEALNTKFPEKEINNKTRT